MTSQPRYYSSNRFISRRLISDVRFMSIYSIVFKKWRGGGAFDPPPPPPVQGRPKKPSLNRVNLQLYLYIIIQFFRLEIAPVQGRPKYPSLNRVNLQLYLYIIIKFFKLEVVY